MLKLAGHEGTIEEMQELLDKGVDINKMKFGCSPLGRAAAMDLGENLLWLIDNKADVNIQTANVRKRPSPPSPSIRTHIHALTLTYSISNSSTHPHDCSPSARLSCLPLQTATTPLSPSCWPPGQTRTSRTWWVFGIA